MADPKIKRLDSGWTYIRFHKECFAQIPPNFHEDIIPDEFIFHPESNRKMINEWWLRKNKPYIPEGYHIYETLDGIEYRKNEDL